MKAREKLNFDLPEMPSLNITAIESRFIQEQKKKVEEIFTTALRTMAEPPIKGEITKGKIRWRGLRMMHRGTVADGFTETWIEQRGKRITPIIRNEYSYRLPFINRIINF